MVNRMVPLDSSKALSLAWARRGHRGSRPPLTHAERYAEMRQPDLRCRSERASALHLLPKQTRLGPCGVWLSLPEVDYVFYEPETSQLHREHIILHELGHLLCEHQPTEVIDEE